MHFEPGGVVFYTPSFEGEMRNSWLITASLAWVVVMGGALLVMIMLY
jgi:hypothetical protein